MRRLLILLILLPYLAFSQFALVTEEDGLEANSVSHIVEGLDGSVWFAGANGISRFYSGQYYYYDNSSTLSTVINAIEVDQYGKIWVGTYAGLSVYDGVNWSHPTFGTSSSDNNIKDIELAENGDLWIATAAGVQVYNGFTYYSYTNENGLPTNNVKSLSKANDGTMWIGTAAGLCRFNNPGFTVFTTDDGLSNNNIKKILATNLVYIFTSNGFNVFNGSNFNTVENLSDYTSSSVLNSITRAEDDKVWLTYDDEILKLNNETVELFLSAINTNLGAYFGGVSLKTIEEIEGMAYVGEADGYYYTYSSELSTENLQNQFDTLNVNAQNYLVDFLGVRASSNTYTGIVIGALNENNEFHLGGGVYSSDWTCGPISSDYNSLDYLIDWQRTWKISRQEVENHQYSWNNNNYVMPNAIQDWPELAEYVDFNDNGIYDPENGDFPSIRGDQAVLSITNDDQVTMEGRNKMQIEVHSLSYAFSSEDSALNNTIFTNYKILNKSAHDYHAVYMAVFDDHDLGYGFDDFVGTDTSLNAFYFYNGSNTDQVYGTGDIPAKGLSFLNTKMTSTAYSNNSFDPVMGDPQEPMEYYNFLLGYWQDGTAMTYGGTGVGGDSAVKYVFTGDPLLGQGWTEETAGNVPDDRRMLGVVGPFDLDVGEEICIDVAHVEGTAWGSTNLMSVKEMKSRLYQIHTWYANQDYTCDSIETLSNETLNIIAFDQIKCSSYSGSIELSNVVYGGVYPFSFEWENEFGTYTSSTQSPNVYNPIVSTDYYITVTDASGATAVDTLSIVIEEAPSLDLGPDVQICNGETFALDLPEFDTYQWNTGSEEGHLEVISAGVFVVTVTESSCSSTDTIEVQVQQPNISLTEATPACVNEAVILSVNTYPSIEWSTGAQTESISIELATAGSYTYSVSVTDEAGCTNSETTILIVNEIPNIDLGTDITILDTQSVVLDAYIGAGANYNWSTGQNSYSILFNGYIGEGTYNIGVDVIDINGCEGSDNIVIDVDFFTVIDDLGLYTLNIYPNPSTEYVHIELLKASKYKLFDDKGVLVKTGYFETEHNILQVSGLAKGSYVLKIEALNLRKKLIIQ